MNKYEFAETFKQVFLKNAKRKRSKWSSWYLWTPFSVHEIKCLVGDAANLEYDRIDKNGAIEIQYDHALNFDESTSPLEKEYESSQHIMASGLVEFYVIGKDFSWCYVVTHERDREGPFFCYASKTG